MSIKDEVTTEVIRAATDNPQIRAAGHELSKAVLTLAKSVNVALLPLAALNSWAEKARVYFQTRLGEELAVKLPQDALLADPRPSIAGPALQALAFAHEEPDLKEMYLNVLAGELTPDKQSANHPGFVEIIRQLTAAEARVFRTFAKGPGAIYVEVTQRGQWRLRGALEGGLEQDKAVVMLENWVRLGICRVDADLTTLRDEIRQLRDDVASEYVAMSDALRETLVAVVMTSFGRQFAKAVGVI